MSTRTEDNLVERLRRRDIEYNTEIINSHRSIYAEAAAMIDKLNDEITMLYQHEAGADL